MVLIFVFFLVSVAYENKIYEKLKIALRAMCACVSVRKQNIRIFSKAGLYENLHLRKYLAIRYTSYIVLIFLMLLLVLELCVMKLVCHVHDLQVLYLELLLTFGE